MARQTKRIRKNIQTTQELEEALEEKPQGREYKPWENIVLVGIICLTMVGPLLAQVGLKFGPPEMASLTFLALTSIGCSNDMSLTS